MQANTEKQVKIMCLFCVLLISSGIFVLGVVLIIKSVESNREYKLSMYGDTISEWDEVRRSEFENLDVQVSHNSSTSNMFVPWDDTDHVTVLDHDYYGELPTYNPLLYYLFQSSSEIGFVERYDTFDAEQTVDMDLVIGDGSVSTISLADVPVMRKSSVHHIGAVSCTRKGHFYDSEAQECVEYGYLSGFWVKVSKTNNQWALNETNGGFDWTGSEQHQSPYKYDKIFIQEGYTIESYLPLELRHITAKVRSGHDPYFTVELLTESSNDFGIDSTTAFVLGVVALFIAILISIQPIYLLLRVKTHGPLRFDQLDENDSERGTTGNRAIELRANNYRFNNRI